MNRLREGGGERGGGEEEEGKGFGEGKRGGRACSNSIHDQFPVYQLLVYPLIGQFKQLMTGYVEHFDE